MSLSPLLRRLRGIGSTALLWATTWLVIGAAVGIATIRTTDFDERVAYWPQLAAVLFLWSAWGAVSGVAFAVAVAVAERRVSLAELSMVRTAMWGGLGSAGVPAVFMLISYFQTGPRDIVPYAIVVVSSASLGAALAAASLALARRAPRSAAT